MCLVTCFLSRVLSRVSCHVCLVRRSIARKHNSSFAAREIKQFQRFKKNIGIIFIPQTKCHINFHLNYQRPVNCLKTCMWFMVTKVKFFNAFWPKHLLSILFLVFSRWYANNDKSTCFVFGVHIFDDSIIKGAYCSIRISLVVGSIWSK